MHGNRAETCDVSFCGACEVSAQVNIPAKNIRLVCIGRIWQARNHRTAGPQGGRRAAPCCCTAQDTQTVGSYEPKDGVVVHCLNNPRGPRRCRYALRRRRS